MRKIINSTYITLDGAVEDPHLWPSLDGAAEDSYSIQNSLLESCDAVLMGHRTYDAFASVWPTRYGDSYSDRINAMQKDPTWNNTTVISDDVAGTITRLKQQPGKDIIQYGLGEVSFFLMDNGLIDELRLWLHPLILGREGPKEPHFRNGPLSQLRLVDSQTLSNGIAILKYDVVNKD